ncbi:hypothetical protein FF2_037173 [Malus domestica]
MPLLEDPPFNFIVYDTISATPYTSQAQDYSSETTNNSIPPKKFYYCNNAAAKSSNTSVILEAAGGGGGKKTKQMSSNQQPQGQGEGQGRKKRRRKARVCKNKEEAETQRMTHIAVERNRRKQMNDHLAILRSLMPDSYAQRGDQASIVGGAIEFVKELEHLLLSLEAQKLQLFQHQQQHNPEDIVATPSKIVPSSPFTQLLEYPQKHSWSHSHCPNNKYTSKTKGATADIEVTLIETHANLKILSRKNIAARSQLSKLIAGIHSLHLTILHLTVSTVDPFVLYSISLKIEEGCLLSSADDIAASLHHMLRVIEEAAARLLC